MLCAVSYIFACKGSLLPAYCAALNASLYTLWVPRWHTVSLSQCFHTVSFHFVSPVRNKGVNESPAPRKEFLLKNTTLRYISRCRCSREISEIYGQSIVSVNYFIHSCDKNYHDCPETYLLSVVSLRKISLQAYSSRLFTRTFFSKSIWQQAADSACRLRGV